MRTWRFFGAGISRSTVSKGPFGLDTCTAFIRGIVVSFAVINCSMRRLAIPRMVVSFGVSGQLTLVEQHRLGLHRREQRQLVGVVGRMRIQCGGAELVDAF